MGKGTGRTTRLMEVVLTFTRMVRSTLGNGLRTSKTEMALKLGLMVLSLMDSICKAGSTVKANSIGLMVQGMMGRSLKMIYMELAIIDGVTTVSITVSGKGIRCMERVSLLGVMVAVIQELT